MIECFGSIGGSCAPTVFIGGQVGDFLSGLSIGGNLVCGLDRPAAVLFDLSEAGKFTLASFEGIGGNLVESFTVNDGSVLTPVTFSNSAGVGSFGIALVTFFTDADCVVPSCFSNATDALLGSDGSFYYACIEDIVLVTLDDIDVVLLWVTAGSTKFGNSIGNAPLGTFSDVSDNLLGVFCN